MGKNSSKSNAARSVTADAKANAAALAAKGVSVARSLVGNYVTSLDMAGCSITVTQFDDDMLRFWDAPVHTSALRWGM